MRTFFAAVTGLLVAAVLVAVVILPIDPPAVGSLVLVFTLAAIIGATVSGGFIAARIHSSSRAVSAFAVLQLFFTVAALAWRSPLPVWFRLLAILVVVPGAALGGKLAGAPVAEPGVPKDNNPMQTDGL
jgi:hypothetical protein